MATDLGDEYDSEHPAYVAEVRAMSRSDRIANTITREAGSMRFVYLHIAWFGVWILWNSLPGTHHFDPYPFGALTLVVSLEAIFLSTFILISQNRDARFAAAKAEHDFRLQAVELMQNSSMTRSVHEIAQAQVLDLAQNTELTRQIRVIVERLDEKSR
jgi:uncharacterized membrane protein